MQVKKLRNIRTIAETHQLVLLVYLHILLKRWRPDIAAEIHL